jgi:hypothetical protein
MGSVFVVRLPVNTGSDRGRAGFDNADVRPSGPAFPDAGTSRPIGV